MNQVARPKFDFFMSIRGRECVVDVFGVTPAEPDVGIFVSYADDFTVKDLETGQALELTEAEQHAVMDRSVEVLRDAE